MARGERDKADPSLIVETPCIPQPSKRSRGLDYPVTTVNADKSPEKPKAHTGNINRDPLSNKGQSNTGKKPRLTLNTAIKRDKTTPVGEACNPDGTLKDASDMVWVNSPSDLTPPPLSTKRGHDDTDDENLDTAKLMRKQPWRTCTRAGKMTYLDAAWEPKWVEMGMERMRTIFLEYRKIYLTSKGADTPQNKVDKSDGNKLCGYRDGQLKAVNEAWMAIDPDFEFDVDTNPDA
ncbi:hypothetical protein JOM56_000667 [Amanita muscaria]